MTEPPNTEQWMFDEEGWCALEAYKASEPPPQKECWHVIEAKRLMKLLRRAHAGENPDLIYIEEYVNAEREDVA